VQVLALEDATLLGALAEVLGLWAVEATAEEGEKVQTKEDS
jgi:hypothetical protein